MNAAIRKFCFSDLIKRFSVASRFLLIYPIIALSGCASNAPLPQQPPQVSPVDVFKKAVDHGFTSTERFLLPAVEKIATAGSFKRTDVENLTEWMGKAIPPGIQVFSDRYYHNHIASNGKDFGIEIRGNFAITRALDKHCQGLGGRIERLAISDVQACIEDSSGEIIYMHRHTRVDDDLSRMYIYYVPEWRAPEKDYMLMATEKFWPIRTLSQHGTLFTNKEEELKYIVQEEKRIRKLNEEQKKLALEREKKSAQIALEKAKEAARLAAIEQNRRDRVHREELPHLALEGTQLCLVTNKFSVLGHSRGRLKNGNFLIYITGIEYGPTEFSYGDAMISKGIEISTNGRGWARCSSKFYFKID